MLIANYMITNSNKPADIELVKQLKIIIPLVALLGVSGSFFAGRTLLQKARQEPHLENKLTAFRKLSLIKMALLEFPAIITILGALLANERQILLIALALTIVMVVSIPSKTKVMDLLDLDNHDRSLITRS
jgi:hypothetical protein